MTTLTPVDPTLFVDDTLTALVGTRCNSCGTVTFPRQSSCPKCTSLDVVDYALPTEGTVWAFTVQCFPPKTPYVAQGDEFAPYPVGYVDLGGEVLVESRLIVDDVDRLAIGDRVRLTTERVAASADWVTFAFTNLGLETS